MGTRGLGGELARTRAALAAAAAALVLPATAQADTWVDLYEWGASQPVVQVEAGETVHFTNWSGLPSAIASENGLFDSGVLGPGAGYSVVMTVPGSHAYATASLPDVDARIDVVLRELPGPPDALVNDHIPRIAPTPAPPDDIEVHPRLGTEVSALPNPPRLHRRRRRLRMRTTPSRTPGCAIIGATSSADALLVQVPPFDEDAFEALDDALDQLREEDAVDFASMSFRLETQTIPAGADTPTREFPGNPWRWDLNQANADGGNWGLERSRFPQAWNLREAIENRANRVVTGIIDAGYDSHADLPRMSLEPVCINSVVFAPVCSATGVHLHGTHVAGIIGADHNGASPTEPGRTRGVAGANPVAEIRAVNWNFYPGGGWDEIFMIYDLLLDEAAAGVPLRAINFSVGLPYATESAASPNQHLVWAADWWRAHPDPVCGPGNDDDGTETAILFCTPNNDDDWLAEIDNWGLSATRIARRASSLGVLISQAAGNDGATFCVPSGATATFLTTLVNSRTGACHDASSTPEPLRAEVGSPFAAASREWLGPLDNPTVIVENLHPALAGALSSNVGGDVSAPGTDILSTFPANNYDSISGTSMAAPHVAGLITYLLAFDPTLTVGQVREKLETWAVNDVTFTAPRIDAYATLMSLPEAHKAMVDVNDPSKDGNRRMVLERGNVEGALDGVLSSTSGHFTDPDGHVDMRDFRRFRDSYLQTTTDGSTLNGPPSHEKRDLNFDSCTYYDSPAGADADSCLANESTFARFDFNGNGDIGRFAEAPVPTEGGPVQMTDLRVMERQWDDDLTRTEGWGAADLEELFPESGDVEIHADALFDSGAASVTLTFRNPDTGAEFPPRTLSRSDGFLVATVPAGELEITASAGTSSETVAAEATIELAAGEDERVDLCAKDLVLSASRTRLPAGGGATAGIFATFDSCEGGDLSGKTVTFSIVPITPDGATLVPETATTDSDGHAQTTFRAGAATAVYTVSASLDLGEGQTLDDEIQLEVVRELKVAYAWRQEILEWSEAGSSRWGPPIDPLMPDCVAAGVGYCIDTFTLSPAAPFNALEREGVISGLGNELTLTEEVAPSPNSSRQSWTLTDPGGGNPRSDEAVVQWRVADDQLTRYTDFELPDTVRTRDEAQGIRLFGLRAIAGLGYQHDASFVEPPDSTSPVELWFTTGRMLLQPRGDGSSLQYAPRTTVPILIPRQPDGSFAPYHYCQTIEYDLTSERGYWDPAGSEWVRGATSQNRKTTFSPGDRPMPVGPGRIRVRYAFGAVAAYSADDPVAIAPACETTSPPDASFFYGPAAVDEGRMVAFTSTSTDPENDIVSWEWNFGDGTVESGLPNTFGSTGHLFKDDGVYEVSLTAIDSEGQSDTATQTILVSNLPPEANIEDTTGVEGQTIVVPFSVWDPSETDSRTLEVEITLAGQSTPLFSTTREAGFSTFRVSGLAPGSHTLTLRVEDPDGAVATDTAAVTVLPAGEEPPPPPPPPDPTPTCDPGVALDAEEQALVGLLNAYRAQNGLPPVGVSPTLTPAAERHANDMAENDHFSHTGSDDSTPFERAKDAGYPGETVSENLFFGSPRAADAMIGWKSSQTGHNENMLQPQWRAIGIARQFGSGKWFWATSYGDVLDCPGAEDDAAPLRLPIVEATVPAAAEPRSLLAAHAEVTAEAAAAVLPYDPLAAFTISNVQPRENQAVTVVNRSRDAAGTPITARLEYGDGQVVELAPDAATEIRLPGQSQALVLTATDAGGRDSEVERQLWVEPLRPPAIQYLGETFGAVGRPLPVSARVLSPWDNMPVAGLQVTFALAGASVVATTDADGIADATLVLTGATAGDRLVTASTPATDDLAAASISAFVTVVDNHPPVAKPGGPYVSGDGGTLLLDGGLSTDPDPGDGGLLTYAWDLDGDGAFDDAHGVTPAELQWEEIRLTLCGGLCVTGMPYPIALQVTDRWGDTHSAGTTVTFTADFGLILGGGTITIVPGASNSVAVGVVGSSGWREPVTLSVTGLPAGVTATFSKNPVTPTDTSVLTLTASSNVENGTFPVRVIGTGGGITRETGEDITVAFGLIPICFGTYSGTVVDSVTGAPVPDVWIRLQNLGGIAFTDENGRYVFRNVPLGTNNAPRTHFVRTEHNGYWEKQLPAQAACRGVTRLDFEVVAKLTGRLSGTVIDRETRLPLTGARLTAFDGPTTLTDTDGRYALDLQLHANNQPRFYTYKAEATGYWPQELSATVDPAAPQERNYELLRKCQGTIRGGTVRVQQTNALVANAVVRLTLSSFQFVQVLTNAQGEFTFNRLVDLGHENTPVHYSVQAFPPAGSPSGSASGFSTFFLESCGAEASTEIFIRIPVENRGALEGVVRDEETLEPLGGATVRACLSVCNETLSAPDGTYRFPSLHVGYDGQTAQSYTLTGIKSGHYTTFASPSPTVRANETTQADLKLLRQRYGRLEGTITDVVSGAPIPEAAVQDFFGCAFNSICAITNRDGQYADPQVPLGTRNAPFFRSFTYTATGYWPVTRGATFTADTTQVVNVQLLKECEAARVVGTVVNAETQAPIFGALVAGGGKSVLTDASGRFTLTGLRAGAGNNPVGVSITASASGFISQTKSITIFCGATIVVDFGSRESALGTIVGTVTNADASAPIEDVLVATEFGATEWTDASGNYRFEHVPLGDLNTDRAWKVTAFPTGFKPQTKLVVAKANVEVRGDFAFTILGNATPVADALATAVDEDREVLIELTGSDADGDPLTFHIMRYPGHGRLIGAAPNLRYLPDRDFNGDDTFEVVVNDGLVNSERATVTIDVRPLNDPPAGFQDLFETGVGVPLRIAFAELLDNDTDVDGDALSVTNVFPGSLFQVDVGDGFVDVTPPAGFESANHVFAFNYALADGHGGNSFGSAYVRVTRQPLAPVCADASFTTDVDVPLDGSVTCTDGNGDALTYELVSGPAAGFLVFDPDGTFTLTPATGFTGTTSFVFRATDGTLTSAPATATVAVVSDNAPPVATDTAVTTDEDTPVDVDLPATDPDGDTLTITHTQPAHGSFDGTTYTPAANYFGADSFTYTATDPDGAADSGLVTIAIASVNDLPVVVDRSVGTDEDTPLPIVLGGTDVDLDALAITTTQPGHGTFADGTYTPAANYHGPDSFEYTADDGHGGTDTATVAITVRPVNDAPLAGDLAVETDEDTPLAITLTGTDVESDALTFTTSQPSHGTFANGTYTPAANYHGPDSFEYTADDGHGGTDTATVAITVRPVNDAPVAGDQAVGTDEDSPLAITLGGSDLDGDGLTYAPATAPQHGTWDGTNYTPSAELPRPRLIRLHRLRRAWRQRRRHDLDHRPARQRCAGRRRPERRHRRGHAASDRALRHRRRGRHADDHHNRARARLLRNGRLYACRELQRPRLVHLHGERRPRRHRHRHRLDHSASGQRPAERERPLRDDDPGHPGGNRPRRHRRRR